MPEPPSETTPNQRSSTPIDVHVGKRMRARRLELALSQDRLAGQLGINLRQVQKYERGENRISASRLYQVAEVLQVPIWYFFKEEAEGESTPALDAWPSRALANPATLRLVRAFERISDPGLQAKAIDIVEGIASPGGS